MLRKNRKYEADKEFAPPPALDATVRVVVCISGSPEDIAGRVQRSIGEFSSASDRLHVSHAIAPRPTADQMLYSALIVLGPAG